jgi:hypothetical protein
MPIYGNISKDFFFLHVKKTIFLKFWYLFLELISTDVEGIPNIEYLLLHAADIL